VGDVRAMIEPGVSGWIVPPRDPPALGGAIEVLAHTPPTRLAEMGRAGALHVRAEFSVAKLVERTLDVYRLVLRNAPGSSRAEV
jgi:glycosyltransferase involved in cell wall biosynthesis